MTRAKILHIEDDPNIRELVSRVLEDQYVMDMAANGLEGVKKATKIQPDLILMDLQLPNMSGYEATTRIHSIDELKDVPIIAVTGNNTAEEREKTLAAGCKGFIPKPIDLFTLPDQIAEYLSGKTEETTEQKRSEYFKQYSEELVKKLQDRIEELTAANKEMRRLNLELKKRDQYIENMLDALWVVSDKDKTLDMNPALPRLLGYPQDDLLDTPIYQYMDSESRKKYFNISVDYLQQDKPSKNELTFFTVDGETVKTMVSSHPITPQSGDAPAGNFHVLHDITERKQLEVELKSSEKKYRSLVNNSLIGIFRATFEGKFATVNPRLAEILGFDSPEELYQLDHVSEIFRSKERHRELVRHLEENAVLNDEEFVLRKKTGEEMNVIINVQKVQDEIHNTPVYEGLIEDITEKRRLEISLKQANRELEVKNQINKIILSETRLDLVLRHLIRNALEILEVDAAAIYLFDKDQFQLKYGYGQGLHPDWIHHFRMLPLGEEEPHFLVQSFMKNQALVLEDLKPFLRHYQPSNQWSFSPDGIWISMPIALNDKVLGVLLCVKREDHHLDEQEYRAVEALTNQMAIGINHVNQIEDLNQSKMALEESFSELAKMNKFKDEFLANMSHELRTPLNSIIGFSEVLIDGLAGELNGEQFEFMENIHGAGQHLLLLINDILDMSKIRSGQMELYLEEVNCRQFVEEINQTLSGIFRSKDQKYTQRIDDSIELVRVDKKKIKQVLVNLLGNASKFTPEGGTISLEIYPSRSDGKPEIKFVVSDNGIGVEPEFQKMIFDEFRQVDGSHSREYEGTGLGLPIAKKLIELHGGKISINSEVGEGTSFHFTIPVMNGQSA